MEENPSQVSNTGPAANTGPQVNNTSTAAKKPAETGVPLTRQLVAVQPVSEKTCPVCGHINRAQAFMCEMCSNYLID